MTPNSDIGRTEAELVATLVNVTKLTRDMKAAAIGMGPGQVRFLVDAYYAMQKLRVALGNQAKSLSGSEEPHMIIAWTQEQMAILEAQVKSALDKYSLSHPVGEWMRSIVGIGPVISAGMLAHISLEPWRCHNAEAKKKCRDGAPCTPACGKERIRTVGHIWSFAGLNPDVKWEKGQKRPFNARLKTLCWKLGESFVKVKGNENDYYGGVYERRRAFEEAKNQAGDYAAQAKASLENKNYGKDTEARAWYEKGMLPPARLYMRSKRYAVKLFLAHLHEVWYWNDFKEPPPKPYVLDHLGHVDYISPPNFVRPAA